MQLTIKNKIDFKERLLIIFLQFIMKVSLSMIENVKLWIQGLDDNKTKIFNLNFATHVCMLI